MQAEILPFNLRSGEMPTFHYTESIAVYIPGLLGIAGMELELSELFTGRKVDLRRPKDLSPYFRQDGLATAEVQYDRT